MISIAKPTVGEEEKKLVMQVLDSGQLAMGHVTEQFEQEFAKYIGTKHAVACGNGTLALMIALNALDIKGEVLVPSFTFMASATSCIYNGLKPVFVDIDPKTFCMDAADAAKKITPKTKAIMPVHLYGQCCDMDAINALAEKHSLAVVEDACQAHGAEWNGKKAGALGTMGCFSFYPTKNMTTAEGGMITTNDDHLAGKMRLYRAHGMPQRYVHTSLGYNFRITDVQSAIGLGQLHRLDKVNEARRSNAAFFDKAIKKATIPFVSPKAKHVYHQYTIRTSNRDAMIEAFNKAGIGYGIYYPTPIHRQQIMQKEYAAVKLPVTDNACSEVLSIPVHPALSKDELKKVAETINSV